MSRKDIIIISVLVNTGLLAVLFVTALKTDSEQVFETPASEQTQQFASSSPVFETNDVAFNQDTPPDEVDQVLREYLPEIADTKPLQNKIVLQEPIVNASKEEPGFQGNYVEVVVKRGDALEKIARANRTTVDAIRKANGLQNDKLKIGQTLKVPVGNAPQTVQEVKKQVFNLAASSEPEYYVVKSGDNPWKIAKLHNVKFEDLLILNQLDEERAKNLKVGEKIRVR